MNPPGIPLGKQIQYASGMMGWSILVNISSSILIYFYVPPSNSGLPVFISQAVLFGLISVVSVIAAGSRLADAITNLFVAEWSDNSKNRNGRRIPFMRAAIIPSLLFSCLVFYPLQPTSGTVNTIWLAFTLVGFYVASTTYVIPYNALLPEMAVTSKDKVSLSTWQSLGFAAGMGVSANVFNIAGLLEQSFEGLSRLAALQYTVVLLSVLAAICMAITAWGIDEKQYIVHSPKGTSLRIALKQTLANRNFRLFIVADFSFFVGLTIITSGLLYFVTVLLGLPATIGNKLMIIMLLVSLIFYPVTNWLAERIGKKRIVIISFLLLAFVFAGIYLLGRTGIAASAQIYVLITVAAIPAASLNILPMAILAEIITKDSEETGSNKEAVYFAVRYFFVKLSQMAGIAIFTMLLVQGKDVGHDTGIRLNGLAGFILCVAAAIIFTGFKEERPTSAHRPL